MRHALILLLLTVFCVLPAWALSGEQEAILLATDGTPGDMLGDSVAVDGDTALIGAHRKNADTGAAYVFAWDGNVWTQQAKLVASDGVPGDQFGWRVALDDDTALVATRLAGSGAGAVYVFTRSGGAWSQQTKLLAPDGAPEDWFGQGVAVAGDTAVVGAYGDDDNGSSSGSAYVFVREAESWSLQAKLQPDGVGQSDLFGASVALDGNTAVVGAIELHLSGDAGGSAYVFTRTGEVWEEQGHLFDPDGVHNDLFGWCVDVDGDTALVGDPYDDDGDDNYAGSVLVFTRSNGVWTLQTRLVAPDRSPVFGWSLAVEGDIALVGAYGEYVGGPSAGAVFGFRRYGGTWTPRTKLLPSVSAPHDRFGRGVALSGDIGVFGAPNYSDSPSDAGSAYVFRLYDDNVPATGVIGATVLLLALLGSGVYIVRRRPRPARGRS